VKRSDYSRASLERGDLDPDPMVQFERWFAAAAAADLYEPTATTLATVGADGLPDARVVLLRGTADGGFQFYTNYDSKKGRDLAAHPVAALILYWSELERQIRIRGHVSILAREGSEAYFASRPRASQLGAWLSHQSDEAPASVDFQAEIAALESRFAGVDVPLPPRWGGYHVTPDEVEFWQGRPNRLHDRFLYRRGPGGWDIVRLYP
jgi:pyridoxamine 5'-phosphate oxidase